MNVATIIPPPPFYLANWQLANQLNLTPLSPFRYTVPMPATIYTDGGARGNPGPAGIGAVLKGRGETLHFKEYIGETTNNVAEYKALIKGLTQALKHEYKEVTAYLDSELIVKQIKGEYKVKQPHLIPLYAECRDLISILHKFSIHHIRRELNKEADKLVNLAIDEHLGK